MLEIIVWTLDRHTNVAGLNKFMGSQLSSSLNLMFVGIVWSVDVCCSTCVHIVRIYSETYL
jgi:hypothetical protein